MAAGFFDNLIVPINLDMLIITEFTFIGRSVTGLCDRSVDGAIFKHGSYFSVYGCSIRKIIPIYLRVQTVYMRSRYDGHLSQLETALLICIVPTPSSYESCAPAYYATDA